MAGVSRRLFDGGARLRLRAAGAAPERRLVLGRRGSSRSFQIPFIFNFFWSIRHGEKVDDNPWDATTLEWAAPSPPPHGNFLRPRTCTAGPTSTAFPARRKDFSPQHEA